MYCGADITAENILHIEYISGSSSKGKFRKKWVTALVLIFILVALVVTRPNKEQHAEKIKELAMSVMTDNISDEDKMTQGLAIFFGPFIVDRFMDLGLQVDDYLIFNIGRIKFQDTNKPVSIGIFNNVFLLVEPKQIREAAKESEDQ